MIPNWAMRLPWHLITFNAAQYSVDPHLVASVIMVESSGKPCAVRYEKNWKYFLHIDHFADKNKITEESEKMLQATSMGMMQVMGSVARELGFERGLVKLCEPKIGIQYGCMKLRQLFDKHRNLDDVIASYNAGSPRYIKDSEPKEYVNQIYVDKVKKYMSELKGRQI